MRYSIALPQACFDSNANPQPDGNTVVHKRSDHLISYHLTSLHGIVACYYDN